MSGYERSDINVRGAVRFTIWLALATVGSLVLMLLLYNCLEARRVHDEAGTVPATRIAPGEPRRPPNPFIQVHPATP
jgi:hypothetical protein